MAIENGWSDSFRQRLTEVLAARGGPPDGDDPWLAIAQSLPGRPSPSDDRPADERTARGEAVAPAPPSPASQGFVPVAPATLEQVGLTRSEIESLVLKYLMHCGAGSGRDIAEHLRLPFRLLERLLRQLKESLLLVYKSAAPLSDYVYELTEVGLGHARRCAQRCTYFGAAPVSLRDYVAAVEAQSITKQQPRMVQLRRAFDDLLLNPQIVSQLGQAMSSGLGLFLYGAPGNGKTCIAERIVKAYGESVWVPRALSVFGEIVRLYDPGNHESLPGPADSQDEWIDKRWMRIRRPTIIVGGELTLDSLEINTNTVTGISEAPLQMKANCGVLVIDDFGRQRVSTAELLNRWIVPLEKRFDYLSLSNGRKFQVPFDQLIVFSTNLEPKHLVDEAFLRRIPYKVDIVGPGEEEFRQVFRRTAEELRVECRPDVLDYLIEKHYRTAGRQMRFCHPRDLLRQVRIYCDFHELPPLLTREASDAAVRNYFAIL